MEEETNWGAHLLKKCINEEATEYHRNTFEFLRELAYSVKFKKKDGQILVTGERGIGKSSVADAGCLMLTQPELGSIAFEMKKDTCFSSEDIGPVVESAGFTNENSYIIDESMDVVDSRDSLTHMNKAMSKFMNSARKMRNIFWWCVADVADVDSRIKNRIVKYWLHVYYQTDHQERDKRYAVAALFRKDLNPFNPDKWGITDVSKQKRAITTHQDLFRLFKKVKSFCGNLAFPILPQSVEDEYEKLSMEAIAKRGKKFNRTFDPNAEKPQAQSVTVTVLPNGKVLYSAVCSKCGQPCQVPFQPKPGKAILCTDCWKSSKGESEIFSRSFGKKAASTEETGPKNGLEAPETQ